MRKENVEKILLRILNALKECIGANDFEVIKSYIDHGEYGLYLEMICATIEDLNIKIDQFLFDLIEKVSVEMNIDDKFWRHLKSNIIGSQE